MSCCRWSYKQASTFQIEAGIPLSIAGLPQVQIGVAERDYICTCQRFDVFSSFVGIACRQDEHTIGRLWFTHCGINCSSGREALIALLAASHREYPRELPGCIGVSRVWVGRPHCFSPNTGPSLYILVDQVFFSLWIALVFFGNGYISRPNRFFVNI